MGIVIFDAAHNEALAWVPESVMLLPARGPGLENSWQCGAVAQESMCST